MPDWQPAPFKEYRWIVADPQLLGGKLAIRGTRLSVSLILECFAGGMSLDDIDQAFDHAFPHEALPEVMRVASDAVLGIGSATAAVGDGRLCRMATWSERRRRQASIVSFTTNSPPLTH